METRKSFFKNPLVIVALGCVMAFAVACGDDDDDGGNPAPQGGSKANMAGSPSTAGKDGSGGNGTAGKNNGNTAGKAVQNEGGGGAGPDPVTGEGGGAGEPPVVSCTDDADKGCYKCAPKKLEQYLNQCPTTGCQDFKNDKLTSLKDGKLPNLPK